MTTTSNHHDVIITGGGVLGLLSARELAAAGLRVAVIERGHIGGESSWAGGGILSPLQPWNAHPAINTLCAWSQRAYPELARELSDRTGIDPEWTRSGLLSIASPDRERALDWCRAHRIEHALLEPGELARQEPALAATDAAALYLPDIAQVRNPRLIAALKADAIARGVVLSENTPVIEMPMENGEVCGLVTPQGRYTADRYVIAAGAWSGSIIPSPALAIAPVKGQMLVFQAPANLIRSIVLRDTLYLIPRRDGHILAGSTVEHTGYDKGLTDDAREMLKDFACSTLPALRDCPIEKHWAGLRPGSPEGIPRIGRHPVIENLYFNCGHFRNGFVMAPASARLLADLILDRQPIVPPEPYRVPDHV
ncbi:glycine oxidase ThiO [Methylococcus sp. EFPC2]|uniref:glycine oxidase ThiO n=1 Tax=Methylococcus sp. EFPC2 TaxID=2812648 RepID=UPI0019678774|nr:glycine oxidase ThiO [Methylococcus sp. EFPC2]QSA96720.1 glycine oxidase ThiO [Methylococcus sp. EFPC2]